MSVIEYQRTRENGDEGIVRGNRDHKIGVSKERPHHLGRLKNIVEGIGSMDIARGVT